MPVERDPQTWRMACNTLLRWLQSTCRHIVPGAHTHAWPHGRTHEPPTSPSPPALLSPQCVAISADESMIAAGDAPGRIQIWRDFAPHVPTIKREGQNRHHAEGLLPTTLHWHASAVGCLSFSPDGTYLLSGGREGVLVQWQVESGRPSFLPR